MPTHPEGCAGKNSQRGKTRGKFPGKSPEAARFRRGSNPSFSANDYKNCSFVISDKHLKLQWIKGLKRLSFKPFFLSVEILQHAHKITKQNLL